MKAYKLLVTIFLIAVGLLPVNARIKEVVVFTDRALVTRELKLEALEGTQELVFENIPLNTDPATIRAKGFSAKGGGLRILDIRVEKSFEADYDEAELKILRAELEELEERSKELTAERGRLRSERAVLEIFIKNSQIKSSDDLERGAFSIEEWKQAFNFYRLETEQVDRGILDIDKELRDNSEQRSLVNRKIAEYGKRGGTYTLNGVVTFEMERAVTVTMELSYLNNNAYWYSLYDARVALEERSLVMGYYAKVAQNSGEEWNEVDLILSTARPDLSGVVPSLSAWILSYYEYGATREQSYLKKSAAPEESYDEDGGEYYLDKDVEKKAEEMETEGVNLATVESQGVNLQYKIRAKSTIPSGNKETKVTIASEIELETDFLWEIVPRYDKNAFIKGNVHNETDFTFLPGKMSIFVDGNYIGESSIGLINSTQEFELSLGRDPRITSEFKLADSARGKRLLRLYERRDYTITVYNNAREDITVKIRDVLPKSSYPKKIVVKLLKIEPEASEIEEDSIYNWELNVAAGGSVNVVEEWEVEYPEDLNIQGL